MDNAELGYFSQLVKAWMQIRNSKKSRINWQFTTKDARTKLKKLFSSIND